MKPKLSELPTTKKFDLYWSRR